MQSSQNQLQEVDTESVDIPGTELHVGRVALGTWAMGGWMWGGTDDRESVATIRAALDQGINLIDTDALSKELAGDNLDWAAIGGLATQDAGDG